MYVLYSRHYIHRMKRPFNSYQHSVYRVVYSHILVGLFLAGSSATGWAGCWQYGPLQCVCQPVNNHAGLLSYFLSHTHKHTHTILSLAPSHFSP